MASGSKIGLQPRTIALNIAAGNTVSERGGARLARRRYQRGSLILKGGKWFGRWREDEIRDGRLLRHRKYELLGTIAEFATRRLALRELENRISSINDPGYSVDRDGPTQTFNPGDDAVADQEVSRSGFRQFPASRRPS
jgi:hypothetical protein